MRGKARDTGRTASLNASQALLGISFLPNCNEEFRSGVDG